VLDDALARIASMDCELSSFVAIDADRARRAAEAAAEEELKNGRWRGHLHDVPIAVKELFDVGNLTATDGSQACAGVVAAADSEVVRRLRRAGVVIVGLTRSHEFGWGHHDSASKRHRDPQSVESGLHQWRFERRGLPLAAVRSGRCGQRHRNAARRAL
jgi:aspartyl-tRNA(Asn)/glutamyl-tRNA(Gln) amidotransferase subunit A